MITGSIPNFALREGYWKTKHRPTKERNCQDRKGKTLMYAKKILPLKKKWRHRTNKRAGNTKIYRQWHKKCENANLLPKFVTTMTLDFIFCELKMRTMAWLCCMFFNNRSYILAKRLVEVTWVCAKLHSNARNGAIRLQPIKNQQKWFGLQQLEQRQFDAKLVLLPPKKSWSTSLIWK